MEYRVLGRTGLRVSEIALGCEGFNGQSAEAAQALFSLALDNGVNCMDLYSPNPEVHAYVSDAASVLFFRRTCVPYGKTASMRAPDGLMRCAVRLKRCCTI